MTAGSATTPKTNVQAGRAGRLHVVADPQVRILAEIRCSAGVALGYAEVVRRRADQGPDARIAGIGLRRVLEEECPRRPVVVVRAAVAQRARSIGGDLAGDLRKTARRSGRSRHV